MDVALFRAGYVRHYRLGTGGYHDGVIILFLEQLLRCFRIEKDLRAAFYGLPYEPCHIVPAVYLERRRAGGYKVAAELLRPFIKSDVVPALAKSERRLHAGGPAADDGDSLRLRRFRYSSIREFGGRA